MSQNMKLTDTSSDDLKIIEPFTFEDECGFFFDSLGQETVVGGIGQFACFVGDNHSHSNKGPLRGPQRQITLKAQVKLLRVFLEEVFDMVIGICQPSPTLGPWVGVVLSDENKKQILIPKRFVNRFVALSDAAEFRYKTSDFYLKLHERIIQWDDRTLVTDRPSENLPLVSGQALHLHNLEAAKVFV